MMSMVSHFINRIIIFNPWVPILTISVQTGKSSICIVSYMDRDNKKWELKVLKSIASSDKGLGQTDAKSFSTIDS